MYKTVTRRNQSVPEAHVSEGVKRNRYGLLLSDSWSDVTPKVSRFTSKPGRTEQGALDSPQSLES